MARKWIRRGLGAGVLVAIGAAAWAGFNWNSLQSRYAAHRFQSAATDEDRTRWAESLANRDDQALVPFCMSADAAVRSAAVAALERHLEAVPPTDARGAELAAQVLHAFIAAGEPQREALAVLLPLAIARAGPVDAEKGRTAVAAALKMPSAAARVAAIRAASLPQVALRSEILPLLSVPEAEVRRAALFAVGPAIDGEPVIGDEDLFHWMHDPDADVRTICRAALVSRGRTDAEIMLGSRLLDPDANERLRLLIDLRYEDELPDVEPWLERLSHDADAGVRAGAARVMMEIAAERKLPAPAWVDRLAETDPEPMVRRVAKYYRMQPARTPDSEVRLVEGP